MCSTTELQYFLVFNTIYRFNSADTGLFRIDPRDRVRIY